MTYSVTGLKMTVHLVATVIWGLYGIIVGSLVVVHNFGGIWAWISITTAVVGNSTHLVIFSITSKGVQIQDKGA